MAPPAQAQAFQRPPSDPASDQNLHLPRILCLHGGGTNALIFHLQCRMLRFQLASTFRFVFADAPFPSRPGPDVEAVFAELGPFRSWLPLDVTGNLYSVASLDALGPEDVALIDDCLGAAMRTDDAAGASGPWIGLLGFSQGAKMAASLLWRQHEENQTQNEEVQSSSQQKQQQQQQQQWRSDGGRSHDGIDGVVHEDRESRNQVSKTETQMQTDFRFGILLAGRAPLVSLGPKMRTPGFLRLPTVHVHGLQDPGLVAHRELLRNFCDTKNARLVEWDGGHRLPIRTPDVAAIVAEIMHVAESTGVLLDA